MTDETKHNIMKHLVTALLVLLAVLAMVGCTVHKPFQSSQGKADYHLRQAVYHYPPYGDSSFITLHDTILIPLEAIRDTFYLDRYDTVTLENERVKVRVIREVDTFYVDAECKEDTVIIYREIPVAPSIEVSEDGINWWKWIVISIIALFLFFSIRSLAKRIGL